MPKVLIAGCGFVGLATARLFARDGWKVIGYTHSEESAAGLSGETFVVEACDIGDRVSVLARSHSGPFDAIVHCASSGRGGAAEYRRIYLEGARNLTEVFAPAPLLFTGSTSVYAQTDGGWVTEDSPAEPDRETGRLLRETEELVLAGNGIVARVAGVYGPGRSVLLRKFFDGTAIIEGDGTKWINQVHRDDIARAIVQLVTAKAHGIFNVNDDQPISQRDLYTWLALYFTQLIPPHGSIDLQRKRGWTNKRVSNARLRALGWAPRFPSFFEAIASDPELVQSARA